MYQPEKKSEAPFGLTVGRTRPPAWTSRLLIVTLVAVITSTLHLSGITSRPSRASNNLSGLCPQVDDLLPVKHASLYKEIGNLIETDDYKLRAVDWIAGAVKIPTESFDNMGPMGKDPRWDVFSTLHDYLRTAFPQVHEKLALTTVNTYGMVFHWQGSDESLKPILLAAHQDVVPVDPNTLDQWVHPPYSGHFDGVYVWGRGSCDDKSGLISTLSAVETLLENRFEPTRTVVLAFGFDEEASGKEGAQEIAKYLLDGYGEDAFALLVDEGGGWSELFGGIVSIPAIAEKGYIDVNIEVNTPGGHSSIPPPHTSIGILSSLLVAAEANPPVHHLSRTQPTYGTLQCLAEHAPDMPTSFRKYVKDSVSSDKALHSLENYLNSHSPEMKALMGTTQAVDLIHGGVKVNALPEQAVAVVNYRIATDSSLDAVKTHLTGLFTPLATKFNLSFKSFEYDVFLDGEPRYGSLKLSDAWSSMLPPAPISPTDSEAFKLLSGTIKSSLLYSNIFHDKNSTVIVAPGIMSGNTDTKSYWNLTRNIVRYSHLGANDSYGGIHTVNEAVTINGILRGIKFFTALILNSDEHTTM